MAATKAVLLVMTDVAEGHDDEFDAWYDEHGPHLVALEGVESAVRYKASDLPELSGIRLGADHLIVYELSDPAVLESEAWLEANRSGPFTHMKNLVRNRYVEVRRYEN
jgi:rubrerythrin